MNLRFWNQKKEDALEKGFEETNKKLDEILRCQNEAPFLKIEETLQENAEQIGRMLRLEYKNGQDAQKNTALLRESIENLSEICAVGNTSMKMAVLENKLNDVLSATMQCIDNIDILVHGRQEMPEEWKSFLSGTRDLLLTSLQKAGIEEIRLLGTVFNSFFAEAVDTVPFSEIERFDENCFPYKIIGVFKRGFVNDEGKVVRKAQVITIEEKRDEIHSNH